MSTGLVIMMTATSPLPTLFILVVLLFFGALKSRKRLLSWPCLLLIWGPMDQKSIMVAQGATTKSAYHILWHGSFSQFDSPLLHEVHYYWLLFMINWSILLLNHCLLAKFTYLLPMIETFDGSLSCGDMSRIILNWR